ncbi:hypothetical protein J0910_08570 [Nocardiopsis sp. CNT-189]|uniref:hypothetical protein n=1 Tax=Nocardiopsis oceanisediminis TaxID=2816862 RepID=UPI003B305819
MSDRETASGGGERHHSGPGEDTEVQKRAGEEALAEARRRHVMETARRVVRVSAGLNGRLAR